MTPVDVMAPTLPPTPKAAQHPDKNSPDDAKIEKPLARERLRNAVGWLVDLYTAWNKPKKIKAMEANRGFLLRLESMIRISILLVCAICAQCAVAQPLELSWSKNFLEIHGEQIPGGGLRILYIEAYCRPGSSDRDWRETVIGHSTELVSLSNDRRKLQLKCTLRDGVTVDHVITAGTDEINFQLTATNPTDKASQADWAQPCIQVGSFTGRDQETYLERCFVFLDGELARMPTKEWATDARYTPGQVWAPKQIDRNDLNPRPISKLIPSNGLIGCFSADEKTILATAWEPYQELFQGVITCIHSDFRIGGLAPGETKKIRGKIYIVPADISALLKRYQANFPQHSALPR